MPTVRDQVFISYSHKDREWLERLQTHLKPHLRAGSISSWSDKQIAPGSRWFKEIQSALANSKVAVLLVSPDFLASDFIHQQELGPLLKEAEQGGVKILWIPVRESAYKQTPLKNYQAVLDPGKPLAGMTRAKRDQAWVKICEEIAKAALIIAATATLPTGSISEAQTASDARMGTYRDARPGEPFSLGGKYVYSLRSVDSMPSHRKGYQILLVKVWVTNQSDSINDFSLQKELSIEIWDKNSNGVARINQAYTEKYGCVSQSLNPEQTTLFLACFEVSDRICREGFKVEFFTENQRVFIPMVPVSGALARP